ncbi:MAG TPA: patatin-like phospholipase family protein [Frankiaceae bacterium]
MTGATDGSAPGFGLVLGAGGVIGQAFHHGVLAALQDELGFDARRADVIVGTSAGSLVATMLRAGVSGADLAASALRRSATPQGHALLAGLPRPVDTGRPDWRRLRPPAGPLVAGHAAWGLVRHGRRTPVAALAAGLLPAGGIDIRLAVAPVAAALPAFGPEPLLLPAVRVVDGRRVVFGTAGAPPTTPGLAAAASCAVPGWFSPVVIDGVAYVDGGAHSPTNADLLVAPPDAGVPARPVPRPARVLILSPMSAAAGARKLGSRGEAMMRRTSSRRLAREVRALREAGVTVVERSPSDDELEVMAGNPLSGKRRRTVVQRAYEVTSRQLADPHVRAVLQRVADL